MLIIQIFDVKNEDIEKKFDSEIPGDSLFGIVTFLLFYLFKGNEDGISKCLISLSSSKFDIMQVKKAYQLINGWIKDVPNKLVIFPSSPIIDAYLELKKKGEMENAGKLWKAGFLTILPEKCKLLLSAKEGNTDEFVHQSQLLGLQIFKLGRKFFLVCYIHHLDVFKN